MMNHDDEYHGDINYGNLYPDDWFWMEDDSDEEESEPTDTEMMSAFGTKWHDGL